MKKQILLSIILGLLAFIATSQAAFAGFGSAPFRVDIDEEELLEDDPEFLENPIGWKLDSLSVYPRLQRYRNNKSLKAIKFKAIFEYKGDSLPQDLEERPVIGVAMCKVPNPYYSFERKIVYKGPLPLETNTQIGATFIIPFPAKAAAQLRKNPATCNIVIEREDGFPFAYNFEVKRSGRIFKLVFNGTNADTDTLPRIDATEPTPSPPPSTEPTPEPQVKAPPKVVIGQDHIHGNKEAAVTLIEYSDPECPFCKRFHPTMQKIMANYGDKVRWVYRHFPLTALHPNAQQKAEASECANALGGQEAFWKFIDETLEDPETSDRLVLTDSTDIAVQILGLDKSAFTECLNSSKYKDVVDEHYKGGEQAGVGGTPATFLIGPSGKIELIMGSQPYATVAKMVENALLSK